MFDTELAEVEFVNKKIFRARAKNKTFMEAFIDKINNQKNSPKLFFFDIDATISTTSPLGFFANKKTSHILQKNHIPYIVITGRTGWYSFNELELKLYGLHAPDAVIAGNGTTFLWRTDKGKLEKDTEWIDRITKNWDIHAIQRICSQFSFSFQVLRKKMAHDKPLFFYYVRNAPVDKLFQEIEQLKQLLPKNVKIEISESHLFANTIQVFSGGIFVVPEICGKAGVVNYILEKLQTKKIDIFLFGDACIDIPMLSLPSTKNHTFHQYLVNPTPLAKQLAKKHTSINITDKKGPQVILHILHSFIQNNKQHLSPAQNNSARDLITLFEPLLNNIIDKKLSANDISFLGLTNVQNGIININAKNPIKRFQGFGQYLFGNFTDLLDGIRARSSLREVVDDEAISSHKIPGQLVDGFCDRAKEFYQLFERAKQRKQEKSIQTYLTALSCSLPSIARATAEMQNIIVAEKDDQGGSMIDRTKLLAASFFFQAIGLNKKSFEIDQEIYRRNMATFESRMKLCLSGKRNNVTHFSSITSSSGLTRGSMDSPARGTIARLRGNDEKIIISFLNNIHIKTMSNFQKNALERFLLYVQLLQEEYDVVASEAKQSLQQPNNETMKQFLPIINPYLKLNISNLRKKYGFPTDPQLSLKNKDIIKS